MPVSHATVFKNVDAVDAWDRWFRWRQEGRLRDITVSDTWQRVTRALALTPPLDGDRWAARYESAFSQWRLLPCSAWLREAATTPSPVIAHAGCVVNLAAHLVSTPTGTALDEGLLNDTASTAVRLVDDMVCAAVGKRIAHAEIGLVGFGTAAAALGSAYDSPAARSWARGALRLLAEAGWRANAQLAAERGPRFAAGDAERSALDRRGVPRTLRLDIERHGLRFRRLTRLSLQPLLARLAGVTDALQFQPEPGAGRQATIGPELKMRACLQPWIDEPIDLPLVLPARCDEDLERCARLAKRLGLAMPFLEKDGIALRDTGEI